MPWEKQTKKVLTGGINLLPPSDIIASDQMEKCVNWRPDQEGGLRSRLGYQSIQSLEEKYVHTIQLVEGLPQPRRYYGAGFSLYRWGVKVTDALSGSPVVFSGEQLGTCSYDTMLWVTNRAVTGRDDGGNFYPWLPKAPEVPPAVAKTSGELSGAVRYYVTFSTDREYESNPSPISDEVSDAAAPFGVDLSAIPVSLNPEVTKRHIYRQGGLLPVPYLVRTITDNATTADTDDGGTLATANGSVDPEQYWLTDAMAIDNGVVMEDDHDEPPKAFVMAPQVYFNRILIAATEGHPNRLYWTPSAMPWYFRNPDGPDGDWVDVGELDEEIVAISPKPRYLVIYKSHSIWRISGDMDFGILEQTSAKTGLLGRKAWASHGLVDYIQGREGIYLFDGDKEYKVSAAVDPIFKGLWSGRIESTAPISGDSRQSAVMAICNDRLYFAYRDDEP